MTRTIAVGIDGSTGSERAFEWALRAAARADAEIVPVMAWNYPTLALLPFPAGLPVPTVEAMQADAEVRASGLVEAMMGDAGVTVHPPVVRQGSAGWVLCDAAEDTDMLVVGSRGLSGVSGALLGSVGSHCISHAEVPVVLVPPDDLAAPSGLVVVGVDGTEASMAAVRFADAWAGEGSTMLLVHAWHLPVSLDAMATALDAEAIEGAATAMLDKAASEVSRHQVETLCVRGDARDELARLAHAADVLVLGANAHGAVHRFLLGSTSHHMAHHLVAPTAIVRPAESESASEAEAEPAAGVS